MIREDFLIKFHAGEFPNIFRAVSLPNGHKTDARGDTRLAVLVSGDSVGAVVECVWADVSIEETRKFSRSKFVWLDSGWRIPGDDIAAWGPLLLRVIETRLDAILGPSEVAKKYLAIAAALDPEIETDDSELETEIENHSETISKIMQGLSVPERLRKMADLLEDGLTEAKSAVNEYLEWKQS